MIESDEKQIGLKSHFASVGIVGLLLAFGGTVCSWAMNSGMIAIGVTVGGAVALLHLWAVAYWVRWGLGGTRPAAFSIVITLLKFAVMFGGFSWLVQSALVPVLPFLLGYAALPLGITLGQVDWTGISAVAKHSNQPNVRTR